MNALLFAQKDLARIRRDPAQLLMWIGIPMLIGFLISLATGGSSGIKPQVHLLVEDQDESMLSGALVSALGYAGGLIRAETVPLGAGRERVLAGDGSAVLVIPEDFGAHALRDEPTILQLTTNPSQRILPGIVEGVLRLGVDAAFYLHVVGGPQLREIVAGPPAGARTLSSLRVAALSVGFNQLADRMVAQLDPLPIELVDDTPKAAADAQPGGGSFGKMLWPGMLLMALFFAAQGLGADLWEERRLGTLKRALIAPTGIAPWLLGKWLAGVAVAALVGAAGYCVGSLFFALPWSALPLGIVWMAVAGALLLLLMWPLCCIASSARAANVLTSCLLFPLLMLGGSFFPFEAMPDWMAGVGRCTPNGWLLVRLRALGDGAFEPLHLLLAVGAITLLATLVVPFCGRRLRAAVGG